MPGLVAVVTLGGPQFVTQLERVWAGGDAILPIDARLPHALIDELLGALRPTAILDSEGQRSPRREGRGVDDGDAVVIATSGTTGVSKGVVLTHDGVAASARATTHRLGIDPTRHSWLACLPVAHIGGLSVITRALLTGTALVAQAGFDAAAVTAAAIAGVTHVSLVATALARIDPTRFERILIGGSAAPGDLPANTTTTYGLTETGSGIWYRDAIADGRPGREGLIPGAELRIVGGGIEVRGPMLLRSYRGPETDVDPRGADGWFATGDAGRLDDGRLVVEGRRGEMIISGGQNIWPQRVERVLADHPSVAEVLVWGRPDPEWGQTVTASIMTRATMDRPTVEELRSFARDHLPPYALPRAVEYVESLPRTALGKLRRDR
jgi:O-succinylbenzoic acid--CoA ligase